MRTRPSPQRPALLWGLLAALLFLSLGGFVGGIGMLVDPSGQALGMHEVLAQLPVASYTLPGLFLLVVMGVGPLLLGCGLLLAPGPRGFH